MDCLGKENCAREEASIQEKYEEKNKLRVHFFLSRLLAHSERYQLLSFPGHNFFRSSLENERMGLHCIVSSSFRELSLHRILSACWAYSSQQSNYQTYVPNIVAYAAQMSAKNKSSSPHSATSSQCSLHFKPRKGARCVARVTSRRAIRFSYSLRVTKVTGVTECSKLGNHGGHVWLQSCLLYSLNRNIYWTDICSTGHDVRGTHRKWAETPVWFTLLHCHL